ncbi:hypothetical protein Tco_0595206 [Tanacetum coccineum]
MNAKVSEGVRRSIPEMEPGLPRGKDHMNCIGAIDGTRVRASFREHEQAKYIGTAHDTRIFYEALRRPEVNFPRPTGDKYYVVDAGYPDTKGYEKKIKFVEQPARPPDPETDDLDTIDKYYEYVNFEQEVACLMLPRIGVSLILNYLNKDFDQFIQNYNMHSMGKSIVELHDMLKLHEKGIPTKVETPAVLAIREGKIHKDRKNRKGLREVGYWKRNCSSYHAELKKRNSASIASTSGSQRKQKVET